MRIGIMGGTFNPIHLGHLIVAEDIYYQYELDKIIFIPSARPPHKNTTALVDVQHRYRMTQLAIEGNPHFEVSDIEIHRAGKSYTIETIKELIKKYGESTQIFFLIGADNIFEISTWKNPDELLTLCKVIVMTRPNFELSQLPTHYRDKVMLAHVTSIDISSTEIRRRIKQGLSIRYLVPPKVKKYIITHRLYI